MHIQMYMWSQTNAYQSTISPLAPICNCMWPYPLCKIGQPVQGKEFDTLANKDIFDRGQFRHDAMCVCAIELAVDEQRVIDVD